MYLLLDCADQRPYYSSCPFVFYAVLGDLRYFKRGSLHLRISRNPYCPIPDLRSLALYDSNSLLTLDGSLLLLFFRRLFFFLFREYSSN